jgi:superfamily I DNA/RNA helicase
LNYLHYLDDKPSRDFADRYLEEIVRLSQRMLDQMQSGKLPLTHDYYLKQFQLREISLPYDFLLFDEAQDASAVMLDVFRRQRGVKLLVGDPHQQIYRWRYAINAMNSLPYPTLSLSTSFRFPTSIADLAAEALSWKNKLQKNVLSIQLEGVGKRPEKIKSRALLARTNMSLIAAALTHLDTDNGEKMWFEGGFQAYTFASNGYSIHEILQLRYGSLSKIRDPLLLALGSYEALQRYVEQTGDAELAIFLQLIELYGEKLPAQLTRLRLHTATIQSQEQADITFSTVHRAKGMEYDAVKLLPDFITAKKIEKQLEDPKSLDTGRLLEEINLLYVALTRSRGWLELPEGLLSKCEAAGIKTYETPINEPYLLVNDDKSA